MRAWVHRSNLRIKASLEFRTMGIPLILSMLHFYFFYSLLSFVCFFCLHSLLFTSISQWFPSNGVFFSLFTFCFTSITLLFNPILGPYPYNKIPFLSWDYSLCLLYLLIVQTPSLFLICFASSISFDSLCFQRLLNLTPSSSKF